MWDAYDDIKPGQLYNLLHEIPGWRLEPVFPDGQIGTYDDDGTRPLAECHPNHPMRSPFPDPAPEHHPNCLCGYRVTRSLPALMYYFELQWEGRDLNNPGLATFALTRCWAAGVATGINRVYDPPGCIRSSQTFLGDDVYLPRLWVGQQVPDSLARKIRARYKVRVHRTPGDIFTVNRSLSA